MEINLKEWTINYVKNKDLIFRKLKDFDESKDSVIFHFKDKDVEYLISSELDDNVVIFLNSKGHKAVVCDSRKSNLDYILKNWNKLKVRENFIILMVKLETGEKFVLNPHVHNKICDEASLKKGLQSLYNNAF